MSNLTKVKLGDILDVKRGMSLSGEYYSTNGSLIRLTLGNFTYPECGFKNNTSKSDIYFVGPVKEDFIMKKGDIITPLTEQVRGLLGNTATIPANDTYIQSGDIGKIIPNEKLLNKRFAFYLISSPTVKYQLDSASQQTKIRHTSPDKIKDCVAFLPNLDYQIKVSNLLDNLNNKIETNNKTIQALESLAKTIYDYWFLQFEFPNEEGKPYKSSGGKMDWNDELKREIPEGWRYEELQSKICLTKGISYTSKNIVTGEGIPMINLASIDINRNYKPNELKYFDGDVNESKKCKTFDLLIACTDLTRNADIIGSPILVTNDYDEFTYSMDLVKLETHDNNLNPMYLYGTLRTDFYHNYIKGFASGTNVLHLNTKGIEWYKCVIPTMNIQNKYSDLIKNIHLKKCELIKENQELASLRDFLLPMLMNGQVTFRV